MDEPFAALDEITRLKLNDELAALQSALGATVVFVTHSVFESVYLADRIVVMAARPGRAVAEIAVDAPPVRREGFRLTANYAETCRRTSRGVASGDGRRAADRAYRMTRDDLVGYAVPAFTLGLGLLAWEGLVRYFDIPPYLLPAPSVIIATLFTDWPTLSASLWVTLSITLKALIAAVVGSVTLAVIFAQSRLVERAFYPFAVAMQVTPIVAIAPLLLIYLSPLGGGSGLRLPGRILSAARQHHARPIVRRPQSGRSVQHVPRDALPAVHAAAGCRRRCRIFSLACASAAASR